MRDINSKSPAAIFSAAQNGFADSNHRPAVRQGAMRGCLPSTRVSICGERSGRPKWVFEKYALKTIGWKKTAFTNPCDLSNTGPETLKLGRFEAFHCCTRRNVRRLSRCDGGGHPEVVP
jgi:hypothetical protein